MTCHLQDTSLFNPAKPNSCSNTHIWCFSVKHTTFKGDQCAPHYPQWGPCPKKNGAGNKQPSVQHYMRHLPVVATLKNIKTFQYVNAVNNDEDSYIKCHYHTYMYICTHTHTHTHQSTMDGIYFLQTIPSFQHSTVQVQTL